MPQAQVSNPNDFKVVKFTNRNDFGFTPEMGCMYDGRPIFGITGAPGINGGESIVLPYHIAQRLAINLAKIVQLRRAPTTDAAGIPTGVPLWSIEDLESLKQSYLEEMYSEARPVAMTETDKLFARVEEYKKMVDQLLEVKGSTPPVQAPVEEPQAPSIPSETTEPNPGTGAPSSPSADKTGQVFNDKQEVIAALESRGIPHDKRLHKDKLELLLK